MTRSGIIKLCILLIVLAGAGFGVKKLSGGLFAEAAKISPRNAELKEYAVRRQTFRVMFTETGKLRAIKNHPISVQIPNQRLSIAWLAPEGAPVKQGDKLVEFATKEFNDQLTTVTADLEKAKHQLEVNKAALEISKKTGENNVKNATAKCKEAEVAFTTYRDLEGPKKLNEVDASINEQRTKLTTAIKNVAEARRQLDEQLFTEEDQRKALEREHTVAKQTSDTAKRILDALSLQKKIFRQYDYPQQMDTKKRAVENSQSDLEKAKVSAEQETNQKDVEVKNVQNQIRKLTAQVERLNDYISKAVITAPVDGLVIYGDSSQQMYYGGRSEIRVGMDWYGGNVIMTIPDLSAFECDINIAEEYRGRVKEGLPIIASIEAVPGLIIKGSIKKISQLGKARGYDYDGSGARFFQTAISLETNDPRMVSGMTAKIEIVADTVADVLAVPIEAVFNDAEHSVCFVKESGNIQKRKVKPARRNANLVEIAEGLNEGEVVSLVEPPDMGPTTKPTKG